MLHILALLAVNFRMSLLQTSDSSIGFTILLILAVVVVIVVFVSKASPPGESVLSHWQQPYGSIQFSAQELFARIEEGLKGFQLNDVTIGRDAFNETSPLSPKHEYLKIKRKDLIYYVSTGTYGTGSYISYWLMTGGNAINFKKMLPKKIQDALAGETFYQVDVELIFRAMVEDSIKQAIDNLNNSSGVRGLAELASTEMTGTK